ncbi:hypothetical protein ACIGW5_29615 [Streptomyces prasinus]|uniref:hypothetical protein n=1 Tax=Streptomyces prasinus TaxID=67345 RepID=UPI0037CF3F44
MTNSLRFERPPVREVTLALMLQSMPELRTLHLAPLRVEWRPTYPVLREVAPLPPWRSSDSDSVELFTSGLSWPMGLCSFFTDAGDKKIRFQQDRFLLSWKFDGEEGGYPGFDALQVELLEKFAQFSKLAHEASDSHPVVKRVDLQYINHLPGVPSHKAMAGLLNGWSEQSDFPFRKPDYAGFRIHYNESELDSAVGVLIGVDSAVGEASEGGYADASSLTLDAEAEVADGTDFTESLTSAHDVLTAAFLEVTSVAMRDEWGEVK